MIADERFDRFERYLGERDERRTGGWETQGIHERNQVGKTPGAGSAIPAATGAAGAVVARD
jgi:hypothetical protein